MQEQFLLHLAYLLQNNCFCDSSIEKKYFWYTWSFRTSVPFPTKSAPEFLKISQKHHNIIHTRSDKCICNLGIEDTNHFLFLWPFLLLEEQPHLGDQSHLYLYGHHTINLGDQSHMYLYGHHTINLGDQSHMYLYGHHTINLGDQSHLYLYGHHTINLGDQSHLYLYGHHTINLGDQSHLYLYGHHTINFTDNRNSSCRQ